MINLCLAKYFSPKIYKVKIYTFGKVPNDMFGEIALSDHFHSWQEKYKTYRACGHLDAACLK